MIFRPFSAPLVGLVSCLALPMAPWAGVGAASAQTFVGKVSEERSGVPVATALVSLVSTEGEVLGMAVADAEGLYSVEAPSPGIYRLEAARIGYDRVETPELEVRNPAGTYPVDLVMAVSPVPIEGITVSVGQSEAARQIQLLIGMNPKSLRNETIHFADIQAHLRMGHDLMDIMRWSNQASLIVFNTADGPCFSVRGSGCLPVFFNDFRVPQGFVDAFPVDAAHAIQVVMPKETILHPAGAVLMYSEAWLRAPSGGTRRDPVT